MSGPATTSCAWAPSAFTIEGATHVDLYDKDEYVAPAVAKLTEFFNQHLTKA